ncbi:MAG TPA: proteasome subunit alpha [Candidatus Methylacidiphilales bacterium]|nr:proteasome subunit alpha [Candidatus Methylacidiphilales bacterium]
MTEEPYRWLEAITNRREYIEDQIAPGLPAVALSADPGVLLLAIKTPTPKLFEIYDHLALASVGHPADIEKVRQAAIDAAHLDGFARSPSDVTARRLVSYNLAPALKAAFEQIFSAPLLFRGILAEVGAAPADDFIWRVDYDGSFTAQSGAELAHGTVITGPRQVTKDWAAQNPKPVLERNTLKAAALSALRLLVWAKLRGTKDQGVDFSAVPGDVAKLKEMLNADGLEVAFLDRSLLGQPIAYRVPSADETGI